MSNESCVAERTLTHRDGIVATLRRRHDELVTAQRQEVERREAQKDRTRSLVRLVQLDTRNEAKIAHHAENAMHLNQRAAVLKEIRALRGRCQVEKKRLTHIKDKKQRHEKLQRVKEICMRDMAVYRQQLAQLEAVVPAVVRPGRPMYTENGVKHADVVAQNGKKFSRRLDTVSTTVYKQLMDQIRAVRQERGTMLDPYTANLELARLWDQLHNTEKCLQNYEASCQMMNEKQVKRIPPEMLEEVLEKQRLRRRTALHYLFSRALQRKQRLEAADLLSKFISLSLPEDRLKDLAYVDRILREQEYIEDSKLANPDEIKFIIRSTNSLGHLTDLRFELLKELLAASPTDPYLIESVANIHVRRGEFTAAQELTARFVALPSVKRIPLYSSLAELQCGV